MQVFSRNLRDKDRIIEKAEIIKEKRYSDRNLLYVKAKNRPLFDGRYNDRKDVKLRIKYFQNFLHEYIS